METLLDGLLHPQKGCPWDLTQTAKSISEDFLEETYELREALASDNTDSVKEEAGDLTFLLFFLGRLAFKGGYGFGLKEIMDAATDKMVHRHPHVFGKANELSTPQEVLGQWHAIKRAGKRQGLLSSVPVDLPALARCQRLGSKAGRAGFDWKDHLEVRLKLKEELEELDEELSKVDLASPSSMARVSEELGDCLASLVNLARHLGLSAEKCLAEHNRRFTMRVGKMEKALGERERAFEDASPEELEELWRESKKP
jgi:MazG family protein